MGHGQAGKNGADPTVREFLPWHEVERKLAARANGGELPEGYDDGYDDEDEEVSGERAAPPDSGVRVSDSGISVRSGGAVDLSYKVYTVAELDRRAANDGGPISVRGSLSAISLSGTGSGRVPAPNHWKNAGLAAYRVLDTIVTWLLQKGEKARFGDVVAHPVGVLKVDLRAALKTVDWRKVAIVMGVAALVLGALLAVVLVVADLTDEMKPARAIDAKNVATAPVEVGPGARLVAGANEPRFTVTTISPSNPVALPAPSPMVAAPAQPQVQAAPAAAAKSADIELDEPAPAKTTAKKKGAPAKKPAGKKAAPAEEFIP